MPEWIIWAIGIWFFFNIVGRRGCGLGFRRTHQLRRGSVGSGGPDGRAPGRLHTGHPGWSKPADLPRAGRSSPSQAAAGEPAAPKKRERRETPEERIRRRFVEGRIDLDRYEAELWEELRPK